MNQTTKTAHTKGPWRGGRAISGPTGLVCRVVSRQGNWKSKTDANRYNYHSAPGEEEADANAALIAAAPDLLEACKMLQRWLAQENQDDPELERLTLQTVSEHVDTAIARATEGLEP
jgi:hypothetical protein